MAHMTEKETPRGRAIARGWKRWRVTQGASVFTCYAETAEVAKWKARLAGFKRVEIEEIPL
ncbi:MAG: hypothetical protein K2Q27_05295 [Novosphingobium sp.]|nr:hypothetical protein [Novosphingobium sp.]